MSRSAAEQRDEISLDRQENVRLRISTVCGGALTLVCITLFGGLSARTSQSIGGCEALGRLTLPHATVRATQTVAAGRLALGDDQLPRADSSFFTAFDKLPAFCRVQAISTPASQSRIEFDVWLPAADHWNGRYVGAGDGGYAGTINYYRLAEAVNGGYVGSSTDTGHRGPVDRRRRAQLRVSLTVSCAAAGRPSLRSH